LYFESTRAASITAAVPDASSLAPGASEVKFIGSVTRLSMWPEITITRSGSVVPRWMASTSITSVGLGMRVVPETICEGVSIIRQPPQSLEMAWNSDATQRRAAPIPRVGDLVSESVCLVPKPTSLVIVARCRSGETLPTSSFSRGCSVGAGWAAAGKAMARAASRARRRKGELRNLGARPSPCEHACASGLLSHGKHGKSTEGARHSFSPCHPGFRGAEGRDPSASTRPSAVSEDQRV
jgi:hypothetical protein